MWRRDGLRLCGAVDVSWRWVGPLQFGPARSTTKIIDRHGFRDVAPARNRESFSIAAAAQWEGL